MGRVKEAPNKQELQDAISKLTLEECKRHFGVGDWAIHKWMEMYDIKDRLRPRTPAPSKEELEAALKDHTHKEVCVIYGIKNGTLKRWLKELSLKNHLFESKSMYSLSAAAKLLGVSKMTLSIWFRKGLIQGAVKLNKTKVSIPYEEIIRLKSVMDKSELASKK
jgi:hypothetical protein